MDIPFDFSDQEVLALFPYIGPNIDVSRLAYNFMLGLMNPMNFHSAFSFKKPETISDEVCRAIVYVGDHVIAGTEFDSDEVTVTNNMVAFYKYVLLAY